MIVATPGFALPDPKDQSGIDRFARTYLPKAAAAIARLFPDGGVGEEPLVAEVAALSCRSPASVRRLVAHARPVRPLAPPAVDVPAVAPVAKRAAPTPAKNPARMLAAAQREAEIRRKRDAHRRPK